MKLYIDSRFRTPESASGTDFVIQLSETLSLPPMCKCRVTNLSVPFSWYTVEENNRYFFFSERDSSNNDTFHVATLPRGQYDGPRLATAIAAAMNGISVYGSAYSVSYSDQRGTITIAVNSPGQVFTLYSDVTLRAMNPWRFNIRSAAQPGSFGRNLRITETRTYQSNIPYVSEFVDLLNIKQLYLCSQALGSLSSMGPRIGQRNCLCSCPVTSSFGYLIVQDATSGWEQDTEVGSQSLRRLDFQLQDADGLIVPLHGLDISFTLSFTTE